MTQGTIFTGALAEDYPGCQVCGIVITARCDLSQDKVSRYTYLPLVKTFDWLQRDGVELALDRAIRDLSNTLANYLRSEGFSEKLLETEQPCRILSVLFPADSDQTGRRKARSKVSGTEERLKQLGSLPPSVSPRELLHITNKCHPRIVEAVLKDLVLGRLSGFYFIEEDLNDDSNGHAVLLREVRHIPRSIAERLAEGLEPRALQDDSVLLASARNILDVATQEMLLPIAQLKSPYVEHLMQNFTMLFSRIGVPDIDIRQLAELLRANLAEEPYA